jgi:hypothetical protein
MGREKECKATLNGRATSGRALLETEEIIFRGDSFRLRIPFKTITKITTRTDALLLEYGEDKASFALGAEEASKWADALKNPKSRADKLGIKPGQKVVLRYIDDAALEGELVAKGAEITPMKKGVDVIFFGANRTKDLEKLATLREKIHPAGAIWIVRPKGSDSISEKDVMSAARAAGLVDVKVVKLSETHTAEKVVIPVADRGKL